MNDQTANDGKFALICALVVLSGGLLGAFHHEMWRDELQAWMLVKDSPTLGSMLTDLNYEGHPGLWYVCLYYISRIFPFPISMQIFHILIGAASVYVLARFAPFSRLQKILFSLGYFPFYEYLIINRHYGLGMFFLFSFCAAFSAKHRNYLLLGAILAFQANTNAYQAVFAVLEGVLIGWDYFESPTTSDTEKPPLKSLIVPFLLFAAGLFLSVVQMSPNPDSCFAVPWNFHFDGAKFVSALSAVWAAYIPFPNPTVPGFWNSNLAELLPFASVISLVGSIALFVGGILCFASVPRVLAFYLCGSLGIMSFSYLIYFGFLRHHGHLFLIAVASFWLYLAANKVPDSWFKLKSRCFTFVLIIHFAAGMFAYASDLIRPFSAGYQAVNYLRANGLDKMIVAGYGPSVSSVAGYLDKPVYYAHRNRFGTFIVFDRDLRKFGCSDLLRRLKDLGSAGGFPVVFVLNKPMGCTVEGLDMKLLVRLVDTIVPDEPAYIYLLSPQRPFIEKKD